MTSDPVTLSPTDIGSDVLHVMMERGIGHIPISEGGKLVWCRYANRPDTLSGCKFG